MVPNRVAIQVAGNQHVRAQLSLMNLEINEELFYVAGSRCPDANDRYVISSNWQKMTQAEVGPVKFAECYVRSRKDAQSFVRADACPAAVRAEASITMIVNSVWIFAF